MSPTEPPASDGNADLRPSGQPAATPRATTRTHPVHRVHRIGAALLGAGLIVFGVLGLMNRPEFFSPAGMPVMGMSSNGALAVLSVLVGGLLVVTAARGGRLASTTTLTVGVLFLVSGFVHLAIIQTAFNVLGFSLPNVFFSFAAGVLLLTIGAYGRLSGGLPPDNPYARRSAAPVGAGHGDEDDPDGEYLRAEQDLAAGRASEHQRRLVRGMATRRADEQHSRAWQRFTETHSAVDNARMRAVAASESARADDQETPRPRE